MGSPLRVLGIGLCAAVAAHISRLGSLAPVALAGLLVAGNVVVLRWRRWRLSSRVLDPVWFVVPLVASWLVVILLPVHKFSHRGYSDSPGFSVEALIEVVVFGVAALVAMVVIRALEPTLARSRPPLLLFLLPIWTAASGIWGVTGAFAIVRGAQLVAVALLAWATIALGRTHLGAFDAVVGGVLRWFVRVTAVLVVAGVTFGPVYVSAAEQNRDRFTWAGAHPLASGLILSVAAVIVVALPPRVLRLPAWTRAVLAAAFVVALVPNHSRQSWIALAVVLLVALGLAGRLTPIVRWVGAPMIGAMAVAGFMYRGPQIWDYLLRNEDTDQLSSGNGRLRLWGIGFRALDSPLDWLVGLGHGVTRTLFVADEPWARSAHSSFLSALVSEGVIGLVLLSAVLLATLRLLVAGRMWARGPTGLALTLLFVLVVLNGVASDNLVEPNFGFAALYLVAAAAVVWCGTPPPGDVRGGAARADAARTARPRPAVASTLIGAS